VPISNYYLQLTSMAVDGFTTVGKYTEVGWHSCLGPSSRESSPGVTIAADSSETAAPLLSIHHYSRSQLYPQEYTVLHCRLILLLV
jgi:hypothetical protein